MRRKCSEDENNRILKCLENVLTSNTYQANSKRSLGTEFFINGGTVLKHTYSDVDGETIHFIEDDMYDSNGEPYCIIYPIRPNTGIVDGDRILLAYSDTGVYIPLKMSSMLEGMVDSKTPNNISNVDWSKCKNIMHPNEAFIDLDESLLDDTDKKFFAREQKKWRPLKLNGWVVEILLSIIVICILGAVFVVLVGTEILTYFNVAMFVLILLIISWLLISIFMIYLIGASQTMELKKLRYKKRVLFNYLYSKESGLHKEQYVVVKECINNEMVVRAYFLNEFWKLPDDIVFGDVITKYSVNNNYFYYVFRPIDR